jgi:hypothetical protein
VLKSIPGPSHKAGARDGTLHTNEGSFNEHDFQRQPHVGMTSRVVLEKPPPLPKGDSHFGSGVSRNLVWISRGLLSEPPNGQADVDRRRLVSSPDH